MNQKLDILQSNSHEKQAWPSKKTVRVNTRKYPADQRSCFPLKSITAGHTWIIEAGCLGFMASCFTSFTERLSGEAYDNCWSTSFESCNNIWKSLRSSLKAELDDSKDRRHISNVDFCVIHLQYPLHPDLYDACKVTALQRRFLSTLALHGLKDASAHFEFRIPLLLSEVQNVIKAYTEVFLIHVPTEERTNPIFRRTFRNMEKAQSFFCDRKCVFYKYEVV